MQHIKKVKDLEEQREINRYLEDVISKLNQKIEHMMQKQNHDKVELNNNKNSSD